LTRVAPSNLQMEPTRLTVCAVISLRRAAHLARWADKHKCCVERRDRIVLDLAPSA